MMSGLIDTHEYMIASDLAFLVRRSDASIVDSWTYRDFTRYVPHWPSSVENKDLVSVRFDSVTVQQVYEGYLVSGRSSDEHAAIIKANENNKLCILSLHKLYCHVLDSALHLDANVDKNRTTITHSPTRGTAICYRSTKSVSGYFIDIKASPPKTSNQYPSTLCIKSKSAPNSLWNIQLYPLGQAASSHS